MTADVVQADDRRHAERSRENRGVIRAAAGVGREAANARPIELRDDRRRELVGDEHARRVEILQQIARPAAFSSRRFMRRRPATSCRSPLRSCRYGSSMSLKTAASSSSARWTAHSALTRSSRTTAAARPNSTGSSSISSCASKIAARSAPLQLGDAPADLLELLARSLTRALERRQLAGDAIEGDRKPDDLRALNRDQRWTDGHARRHADAFQTFHVPHQILIQRAARARRRRPARPHRRPPP